jgi:O-antigen/teichoic acid export membrane protein
MASAAPRSEDLAVPLRREALWGTARIFAADALLLPTGLVTAAYLSRRLGPAAYGVYALAATIVVWLEWSITALFARATFKMVGDAEDWRPVGATVTWAHLVAGVSAGALLALAAPAVAAFLRAPELGLPLRVLSLDIPIACTATAHRNLLVGTGRYGARATASAARAVSRMLVAIALVAAGFGILGALVGIVVSSAAELAIARVVVRPSWRRDPRVGLRRLGEVAFPLLLFAASQRLLDKLDVLLLQRVTGSVEQAGIYAAAQNLAIAPGLLASAVAALLMSMLGRLRRAGEDGEARALARGALRATLLLLPLAALVAGGAPPIVRLVYGASFVGAIPIVACLVFAATGLLVLGVVSAILVVWDHPWDAVLALGPLVVASVAAYAVVIPRLGALGAALVTTGVAVLAAAVAMAALHRRLGIALPFVTLARTTAIALLAFIGARALDRLGDVAAIGALAVLAALVPAALLVAGELSRRDLALLTGRSV